MNDELFDNPSEKLEDALAMLATGTSIEEVLAGTGSDAEWLYPMVELAVEVGSLQQAIPVPSPEASLQKLLAYGEDLAGTTQPTISTQPDGQSTLAKLIKRWWSHLFIGLVVAVLTVGLYILSTRDTAIIESTVPTEIPLPGSTATPTATSILRTTDTPALVPIPTGRLDSTASPTATLLAETPAATRGPVINSTSDTIKLPPTPTATATPIAPLIEPTPTNPLSTDIDNSATPTATPTLSLIEPTPTDDTTDSGNDNTNENDNDGDAGNNNNDNDNDNDNENDSDSSNSGPSGGDDKDDSDDNSGSSNSGSDSGDDDKDNSGSKGGDDNDDD